MRKNRLTVVARLRAKRGMEDRLREELLSLVSHTRSEEGCVRYDLHQGADDPGLFLFYEIWSGRDAWDSHMDQPRLRAFAESAGDLLAGPIDITLWSVIG